MFKTKDSGKRIDYPSGFRRDVQEGKPRYDLIPGELLKRLAELYARGAEKYGGDTPITSKNWSSLLKCICSCKTEHITTTKNQPATQRENMLDEGFVLNAIEVNTPEQKERSATEKGSRTPANYVGHATTESLKSKTPSTPENKEKIMRSGLVRIWRNIKRIFKSTTFFQNTNLENSYKKGREGFFHLGSPLKMSGRVSMDKEICAQSAANHRTGFISTSTTTMRQEKLGGFCVGNVTKDSECLEMIFNELKKHSITCKIHHSIELDDNGTPFVPSSLVNNWQLANSEEEYNRFKASAFRHFEQWRNGWEPEEDHASAIMFNVIAYEWLTKHK